MLRKRRKPLQRPRSQQYQVGALVHARRGGGGSLMPEAGVPARKNLLEEPFRADIKECVTKALRVKSGWRTKSRARGGAACNSVLGGGGSCRATWKPGGGATSFFFADSACKNRSAVSCKHRNNSRPRPRPAPLNLQDRLRCDSTSVSRSAMCENSICAAFRFLLSPLLRQPRVQHIKLLYTHRSP